MATSRSTSCRTRRAPRKQLSSLPKDPTPPFPPLARCPNFPHFGGIRDEPWAHGSHGMCCFGPCEEPVTVAFQAEENSFGWLQGEVKGRQRSTKSSPRSFKSRSADWPLEITLLRGWVREPMLILRLTQLDKIKLRLGPPILWMDLTPPNSKPAHPT